jgi:gamma-glutamyltranspeptidase/glutathione hydrolase
LNLLETFNIKAWDRWSPVTLHVMAEVMRRGSYDAARSLGDPAFVKNSAALTTHAYARRLAQTIDLHKATPSAEPSATHDSEGQDTTHFSIIDSNGMAVANTYTLERLWGSRVVVKNRGFLLNNQMRAFNLFPDVHPGDETNATAPYTIANTIAPGKRPLSSMSPMILARNGQVKLISGSPGSHGIPNTLLCLLINVLDFDMPLPAAVESPRLSHQWLPDEIEFENPERHADLVKALSRMGHTVMPHHPIPFQGDAHSIWVAGPHDYIGVADRRRSDQSAAMGY